MERASTLLPAESEGLRSSTHPVDPGELRQSWYSAVYSVVICNHPTPHWTFAIQGRPPESRSIPLFVAMTTRIGGRTDPSCRNCCSTPKGFETTKQTFSGQCNNANMDVKMSNISSYSAYSQFRTWDTSTSCIVKSQKKVLYKTHSVFHWWCV